MSYILTFVSLGVPVHIGYQTYWLAERAQTRALANGATFASIERVNTASKPVFTAMPVDFQPLMRTFDKQRERRMNGMTLVTKTLIVMAGVAFVAFSCWR